MPSLGTRLVRESLARNVPEALGTLSGSALGALAAPSSDDPNADLVSTVMGSLAGGLAGRVGGSLASRQLRKSKLPASKTLRNRRTETYAEPEHNYKEDTTLFDVPGKQPVEAHVSFDNGYGGKGPVGVNMRMTVDQRKKLMRNPAQVKQLFSDTLEAVDEYAAKNNVKIFQFTGDTTEKDNFYRSMMKSGRKPAGYSSYAGPHGSFYFVKHGEFSELKSWVKNINGAQVAKELKKLS